VGITAGSKEVPGRKGLYQETSMSYNNNNNNHNTLYFRKCFFSGIHDYSGGRVNIWGGECIGHYKKRRSYERVVTEIELFEYGAQCSLDLFVWLDEE
jgi:hypothetical protein